MADGNHAPYVPDTGPSRLDWENGTRCRLPDMLFYLPAQGDRMVGVVFLSFGHLVRNDQT